MTHTSKKLHISTIVLVLGAVVLSSTSVYAVVPSGTTTPVAADKMTTAQSQHVQDIIAKGNQEITRRLGKLADLNAKISSAAKLSASNKTALATQVNQEVSGLTTLKTTLGGETTVAGAASAGKSIFSDYRVYALIVPKIALIRVADGQQALASKIAAVIPKLQANLTNAKNAGKDVASLQVLLDDALAKQQDAQVISAGIEAKVVNLQPSDFNSDHTILSGDQAQLTTARTDLKAAISDITAVRDGLKKLA